MSYEKLIKCHEIARDNDLFLDVTIRSDKRNFMKIGWTVKINGNDFFGNGIDSLLYKIERELNSIPDPRYSKGDILYTHNEENEIFKFIVLRQDFNKDKGCWVYCHKKSQYNYILREER